MAETGQGFNLGSAYGQIVLTADTSALTGVQTTLQNMFSGVGGTFSNIGSTLTGIGGGLTALTAPLMLAGKSGLDTAANFDLLMKQIEMFGNVAPEKLDTVRQFAIQMGADTMFSANDAAGALLGLLKAGFGLEDAMAMLQPTLEMATVGQLSLGQASSITVAAMSQFGLQASDAARVSDLLARGAGASGADVSDLGQALTQVGGIARQWGLSIEDTVAVLGIMANNGIKGAEAGTMLKSTLLNLYRPTDQVKKQLSDLGVTLANADGTLKPFNQVLGELDTALSALPLEQQNEAMYILGGSYGIMGLSTLRAAGGLDAMKTAMDGSKSAAEIAAAMMETFWGRVESLKGSIDSLYLEVLQPFMNDVLAPLVAQLIDVVNGITKWVQANPELANQIMKILALVVAAGPILLGLGLAFSSVGSIIKGFGVIVGALSSPLTLIVAAIGALFWAFDTNFLGIRDLLEPILTPIIEGFQTLLGVIGNFGNIVSEQGLGTAIGSIINAFMQMFGLVGNDEMSSFAQQLGDTIVGTFLTVVTFLQTNVLPVLQALYDWFVTTALPAIVNFVQTVVVPGIQGFINTLGQIWAVVAPGLQALWDWFTTSALPAIVNFVNTVVIPAVGMFVNLLVSIWEAVAPGLQALWDWFLTDGLPAIRDFVINEVLPRITEFINTLSGIWVAIQPALQSLFDWFITTGLPAIQSGLQWFWDEVLTPVVNVLAGVWETVGGALGELWDWFVTDGLPAIQSGLQSFWDDVLTPVIDVLKGIWTSVQPGIDALKEGIGTALTWLKTNVLDPIINSLKWLIDSIGKIQTNSEQIEVSKRRGAQAVITNNLSDKQVQDAAFTAIAQEFGGGFVGDVIARLTYSNVANDVLGKARGATAKNRDSGGMGEPGVPYLIGRGAQPELFIPSSPGTFYPNAGAGAGGLNIQNVTINASTYEGGVAAARGFQEEIYRLSQARGAA